MKVASRHVLQTKHIMSGHNMILHGIARTELPERQDLDLHNRFLKLDIGPGVPAHSFRPDAQSPSSVKQASSRIWTLNSGGRASPVEGAKRKDRCGDEPGRGSTPWRIGCDIASSLSARLDKPRPARARVRPWPNMTGHRRQQQQRHRVPGWRQPRWRTHASSSFSPRGTWPCCGDVWTQSSSPAL